MSAQVRWYRKRSSGVRALHLEVNSVTGCWSGSRALLKAVLSRDLISSRVQNVQTIGNHTLCQGPHPAGPLLSSICWRGEQCESRRKPPPGKTRGSRTLGRTVELPYTSSSLTAAVVRLQFYLLPCTIFSYTPHSLSHLQVQVNEKVQVAVNSEVQVQ